MCTVSLFDMPGFVELQPSESGHLKSLRELLLTWGINHFLGRFKLPLERHELCQEFCFSIYVTKHNVKDMKSGGVIPDTYFGAY